MNPMFPRKFPRKFPKLFLKPFLKLFPNLPFPELRCSRR